MKVYQTTLKTGITRTREFERKGLASFGVNVGTKCGHGCTYCSTGAILRMHRSFRQCRVNPFAGDCAIVDPHTADRVRRDAQRLRRRGWVQLCTLTDAYAPEAQQFNLAANCLEAILSQPDWRVRILTKNAAVRDDFALLAQYVDRILVGLSLTAAPDKTNIIAAIEPHASTIPERMSAMSAAAACGLRTYAMLCPLLPGISSSPRQIDQLVRFAVECRAEEIFAEPVNPRGPSLRRTQEALATAGFQVQADAVGRIRHAQAWSIYVLDLIRNIQHAVRRYSDITKLRFLLYPSRLTATVAGAIRRDDAGVVWLGKAQ